MPKRLESFITNKYRDEFESWMIRRKYYDNPTAYNNSHSHYRADIRDKNTNEIIGKVILSCVADYRELRGEDWDIVLKNDSVSEIKFLKKLCSISGADDYYYAEATKSGVHFQLETVERHVLNEYKDKLEGSERNVYLCAFPFYVKVHENMNAVNGNDTSCIEFSKKFAARASALNLLRETDEMDEFHTYFFGKVSDIKEVVLDVCSEDIEFLIVTVLSGMGEMPVAMSKEVFDLEGLKVGCMLELKAYVKADFLSCEEWIPDQSLLDELYWDDWGRCQNRFD